MSTCEAASQHEWVGRAPGRMGCLGRPSARSAARSPAGSVSGRSEQGGRRWEGACSPDPFGFMQMASERINE